MPSGGYGASEDGPGYDFDNEAGLISLRRNRLGPREGDSMIERGHQRTRVLWNAEVRCEYGDSLKCQILDIAAGGAKLRAHIAPPVGSTVDLVLGWSGAVFPSKIVWRRGNHAGIRFLEDPRTVQARLDEANLAKLEPTA